MAPPPPSFPLDNILQPANMVLITGVKGSGKTDLALRLAEGLVKKGNWQVMTNIYLFKPWPDGWEHIGDLRQLFRALALADKKVCLILDEASLIASGTRAQSKGAHQISIMLDLLRKFNTLIFFITPNFKNCMPKIRENRDLWINKPSRDHKNRANFLLSHPRARWEIVNNIKKTSVKFDTLNTAGFNTEALDLMDLLNRLAPYHSQEYREQIIKYLDNEGPPEITDRELLEAIIKVSIRKGIENPAKAIKGLRNAGIIDYSDNEIYRKIRVIKENRGLFNE